VAAAAALVRGQGPSVTGFSLVSATELLPTTGPLGLLHFSCAPSAVTPAQGALPHPSDCYQLLIGVRETLPPRLAPALIGHLEKGAGRPHRVRGAARRTPADVLLEALRTRARIGDLRFERDGLQENRGSQFIRDGLVPRLVTSEQSNSSVVYGDTFILKLLRRIVPGTNPDLELAPTVLSREVWCAGAGAGGVDGRELGEETYTLGVLQPFVRGAADGWELALRELAKGADFAPRHGRWRRATAECTRHWPAYCHGHAGHAQMKPLVDGMTQRLDAAAQAVPALRPYAPGLRTASRHWPTWLPTATPGPRSASTAI